MAGGDVALALTVSADTSDANSKLAILTQAVRQTQKAIVDSAKASLSSDAEVRASGLATLAVQTQALTALKKGQAEIIPLIRKHTEELGSNRTSYMEFGHIARAAMDELAAGASPLRVVSQEGARAVQAFGELSATARAAAVAFGAVALPLAAVAAALVLLQVKSDAARIALDSLDNSTASLGRVSEVASGTTRRVAEGLADRFNISTAAAAKLVGVINQMPQATEKTRAALAGLAPAIAEATGEDADKIASKLAEGFGNVSSLDSFAEKNRLLTPALQATMEAAKKSNDVFGAQEAVLAALQSRYGAYADQVAVAKQAMSASSLAANAFESTDASSQPPPLPKMPQLADTAKDGPSDAQQAQMDAQEAKAKQHSQSLVDIDDAELKTRLLAEQKFGQAAEQEEVSFWSAKLATVKGSGEAEVAARREITDRLYSLESTLNSQKLALAKRGSEEEISAAKRAAEQQEQIRRGGVSTDLQIAREKIDTQKSALQQEVDAGKITVQQKAAQEEALEDQLLGIQKAELTNQVDLLNLGVVERAAYLDRIRAMEAETALKIQQIHTSLATHETEVATQAANKEVELDKRVGASAAATIVGMLRGKTTFTQAAVGLADKLVQKLIAGQIADLIGTLHVEGAKTVAVATQTTARMGILGTGFTEGLLMQKSADAAAGLSSAELAYKNTYASVSAIPGIGPFIAPAVAAAAFVAVEAFGSEQGIESVPYDNAPFLLHKNETVLPARIAQPLLAMIASNPLSAPSAGGGSGAGGDVHHHFSPTVNVHGRDGKPPTTDDMIRELRNAHRNGRFRTAHA